MKRGGEISGLRPFNLFFIYYIFCHLQLNLGIHRGISPGIFVENKPARNHRGVSPGIFLGLYTSICNDDCDDSVR